MNSVACKVIMCCLMHEDAESHSAFQTNIVAQSSRSTCSYVILSAPNI